MESKLLMLKESQVIIWKINRVNEATTLSKNYISLYHTYILLHCKGHIDKEVIAEEKCWSKKKFSKMTTIHEIKLDLYYIISQLCENKRN